MTTRRIALTVAGAVVLGLMIGALVIALPRVLGRRVTAPPGSPQAATAPAVPGRRIKARLYYVNESGTRLTFAEQDVPFGDTTVSQARTIVAAQLAPPAAPLVSPIPPGSALRAVFVTEQGEAYVDVSQEFQSAHSGGSTNELLSIYAIVNALTVNLPTITSVQLLVNGNEIDTLAGHVDLRRPLGQNLALVE
jgi:spore germination protein GerM